MNKDIADIRKDYKLKSLLESEVSDNPFSQFGKWWNDAIESNIDEINAMTLSTVSAEGKPSSRIMLLKGYDEKGFVFFTNYESRKGKEISDNPNVCLLFFWKELERQVRIEGKLVKLDDAYNDEYYHSRPVGSQVGAWASKQSTEIENREYLETNFKKLSEQFEGIEIPRPDHWGGYSVIPERIEFWQGRSNRLHDRLVYTLDNQSWRIKRLSP